MKNEQSLVDFLSRAEETAGQGTLYLSESEIPKEGSPLGDEDSTAGDSLHLKVELVLDKGSEKHSFTKEYRDDLMYQEDLKLINGLREKITVVTGRPQQ